LPFPADKRRRKWNDHIGEPWPGEAAGFTDMVAGGSGGGSQWYNTPQPYIWTSRMWGHGRADVFGVGYASRSSDGF
ncbi:MAG TPA: hypothetical protein VH599_00005, partial [Ktedonobacterales bacterium]